jgi:hypothetical protein
MCVKIQSDNGQEGNKACPQKKLLTSTEIKVKLLEVKFVFDKLHSSLDSTPKAGSGAISPEVKDVIRPLSFEL